MTITWTPVTSFNVSSSDTGSGTDTGHVSSTTGLNSADTPSATEGAVATIHLSDLPAFSKRSIRDVEYISAAVQVGTVSGGGSTTPSSADTATAADAGTVVNLDPRDTDAASVDPSIGEYGSVAPVAQFIGDNDVASGHDGKLDSAPMSSDTAHAAEAQSVGMGAVPKLSTDSFSGTDAGESVNTGRVAQLIGFDVAKGGGAWATANAAIGPGQTHRLFYGGALPASMDYDSTPSNVTIIASFKSQMTQTAIQSYLTDLVTSGRQVILIYHHEPEGDYTLGSQFVSEFQTQSTYIRGAATALGLSQGWPNGQVSVAMAAAGYPYRNAGTSDVLDGNYLTGLGPYVDMFTKDIYQGAGGDSGVQWPSNGLANCQYWVNWLNLVTNTSIVGTLKPVGITEYGVDSEVTNTERFNRITLDANYLFTLPSVTGFPVPLYCYWWQSIDTNNAQFTDAPTEALWTSIEEGTFT